MIHCTYDYYYDLSQWSRPTVVRNLSINDAISYHKFAVTILDSIEKVY